MTISSFLSPTLFALVGTVLGRDLDRPSGPPVHAGTQGGQPTWDRLRLTEGTVPRLTDVVLVARDHDDVPLGVRLSAATGDPVLNVVAHQRHRAQAERYVDVLLERARSSESPFRGSVLEVGAEQGEVALAAVDRPTDTRADLLLDAGIWTEIDRNIHGLFAQRELLTRLELGLNRGILLFGPPGTGKTQLCRVVAHEVGSAVTVLWLRPEAAQSVLSKAYEYAERLAPSLVLLEDIDLVLGHRARGSSNSLLDFLVSVDGAMTSHNGVVTIATTNDARAIDDAAKRAARFDRIIEVPAPRLHARRSILRRYLSPTDLDIDVERVAQRTEGATGADLREIVRHAVLASEGRLNEAALLAAAEARGFTSVSRTGLYL